MDKPSYIAGEDIWFRAHLVEAQTHRPDTTSRYIYAELINPLKNIVHRVKVRNEEGAYSGYIPTAEDLPEGDYSVRFYTRYMEGLGDDYFFKRNIRIGSPLSGFYRTESTFNYKDEANIDIEIQFVELVNHSPIVPEKIRLTVGDGRVRHLKADPQGQLHTSFKYDSQKTSVLYLEYEYKGKTHAQYISVPPSENSFDVAFFPEGGVFPANTLTKIAFKAINSDGLGEDIEGVIVNYRGDTLQHFASRHLGMGFFWCMATSEDHLSAICKNKNGKEKTFILPVADQTGLSLQLNHNREEIRVLINQSPEFSRTDDLYLVIHSRGAHISTIPWPGNKQMVILPQDVFPSGVIHLLLVNQQMIPISERLLFHINKEEQVNLRFSTDRFSYGKREKAEATFSVTDYANQPLEGNFSVSVTDNNDLLPDHRVTIYSYLLLSSELKGYIEEPASYFKNESPKEESENLDVLLLTQGWRRYHIEKLLKGELEEPRGFMEGSSYITGHVKDGLQLNKPAAGYTVSLYSFQYLFFEETETDEHGNFRFENFELPDSVHYVVQSKTKKGKKGGLLTIDEETFPAVEKILPFKERDLYTFDLAPYFRKADDLFIQSNGMRVIHLDNIVVTGKKKKKWFSICI
ncbi:MAG: hypothetical protein LUG96_11225 [Tannerellaceae bacterium]|nr:hypothetical protein [Tannerellaceae bacterium]